MMLTPKPSGEGETSLHATETGAQQAALVNKPDATLNETPTLDAPPRSLPAVPGSATTSLGITSPGGNGVKPETQPRIVDIDRAVPIPPETFPNPPRGKSIAIPATIANLEHFLKFYKIQVHYNVIRKKLSILVPGRSGTQENADNVALSYIVSLANLNKMPVGQIVHFVQAIGDRNQFNPVANWIRSRPWDGVDRLPIFYATLRQRADFPEDLKRTLMYRWLVSAVAAAVKPSGFYNRGVLTLQGPQSIGKSQWVLALVNDVILRDEVIKLNHHLDAGNKDSIITAVGHLIVEIGELDSSFKKDIARLKGFLTNDKDKVRLPYARVDSEYPRRTVFVATVNDAAFLVDQTGNTRWWTIPVETIDYRHGIDMQQVFAQVEEDLSTGAQWWLTQEEERQLESFNSAHVITSAVEERMLEVFDLEASGKPNQPAMTTTAILRHIGIPSPTNPQNKECKAVLRKFVGDPKRIRGQDKWRVAFKPLPSLAPNADTAGASGPPDTAGRVF